MARPIREEYAAPARTGDFTAASPARIGPDVASVDAERCTAPARYRWPSLGCGLEELDERLAQSLIGSGALL